MCLLTVGAGATNSWQPSLLGPWAAVTPSWQQPKLTHRIHTVKQFVLNMCSKN